MEENTQCPNKQADSSSLENECFLLDDFLSELSLALNKEGL